ncbi:MAG: tRNA-dihydrouridine synthase [Candidatus Aenigmatarchaeota archaeon]
MAKYDLSAEISDLHIDPAIIIASGIYCFPPSLEAVSEYLGALVTKSIGRYPRQGNEPPVFSEDINAMGLPNPGCHAFAKELRSVYPLEKPLIISIFGNSEDEVAYVASKMSQFCDALELNISCPNIKEGEKTGVIVGRDPKLTYSYTKAAREASAMPLIVKLSPAPHIFDRDSLFLEIVDAAVEAGASAFSAINTVPGAMRINVDAGRSVLSAKYGGLSGPSIKPHGIGCIYTIYEHLKKKNLETEIPIIGIGGIGLDNPDDALEYIMAGASAVAFGTAAKNRRTENLKKYLRKWRTRLEERIDECRDGWEAKSQKSIRGLKDIRGLAHD